MVERFIEKFRAPYIVEPLAIKCGRTKRRERRARARR